MVGKLPRKSFPKQAEHRAKKVLELVHTDICGPITPHSISKNRYFLTFIDDFSRKTWVYFLKEKSEAFRMFKKFKAYVEKQSGNNIKTLRSDRGGEFTSTEFNNFCEENGIKRHLTAPYSPQQNGVAERKNRTIMDMVRSMLKSKNVSKELWAEAVACAVYTLNRCKTTSLEGVTPQEAWSGYKPTVAHMKVFGSTTYAHVPKERRIKLDDRSIKLVFVGYDERSKAYRLLDPTNNKIVISRDVQVNEEVTWESKEEIPQVPNEEQEEEIANPTDHETVPSDKHDEMRPRKFKTLREIYETTSELHMVCLLTQTKSIANPLVCEVEKSTWDGGWKRIKFKEEY